MHGKKPTQILIILAIIIVFRRRDWNDIFKNIFMIIYHTPTLNKENGHVIGVYQYVTFSFPLFTHFLLRIKMKRVYWWRLQTFFRCIRRKIWITNFERPQVVLYLDHFLMAYPSKLSTKHISSDDHDLRITWYWNLKSYP